MRTTRTATFRSAALAAAAVAALGLGACSNSQEASDKAASATSAAGSAASSAADSVKQDEALTLDDAWVAANKEGMTAIFGTLKNSSDKEIVLASGEADVDARVELHETVQEAGKAMMQEAKEGLKVPAGGELELKPGGYHIMLMDLKKPIEVGQSVTVKIKDKDGKTHEFKAEGRAFEGANEEYASDEHAGHDHGGHEGHDHAGHEGHNH